MDARPPREDERYPTFSLGCDPQRPNQHLRTKAKAYLVCLDLTCKPGTSGSCIKHDAGLKLKTRGFTGFCA